MTFMGWGEVAKDLYTVAASTSIELNDGQRSSLRGIAERLPKNGVIIADEVGMGKTRIAAAVARSVISVGGRVAILVPPGLGYQWGDELRKVGVEAPEILRSLDAYLAAWKGDNDDKPWAQHKALIISHAFCNWQVRGNSKSFWKWSLLPKTLSLVQAKLLRDSGKLPKGTRNNQLLNDNRITKVANWILKNSSKRMLKEIANRSDFDQWGDKSPLFKPENYLKHSEYRKGLENIIGLGLGVFDLIILDEAHKSRGAESNLNRLLEHVMQQSSNARRLAMTATPVELDVEQWMQALNRIKADGTSASSSISTYAVAVKKVRATPNDASARTGYKTAAEGFKNALSPYLLRRDKREDPAVKRFAEQSGEFLNAYRRETEILVDSCQLSPAWQQAICAAEALSFVTSQSGDAVAKRLRLTLGNGHGIATLMDQIHRHEEDDKLQTKSDETQGYAESNFQISEKTDGSKKLQRAEWWKQILVQPASDDHSGDAALYDHPAILAAVDAIDEICQQGEKVLVFGRFTRPLRALVNLLNARAMLQCVDEKRAWPQSKVHEKEDWSAIIAAHKQLQRQKELNRELLDDILDKQYQSLKNQRRKIREKLILQIEDGFTKNQPDRRVRALFDAFKKTASEVSEQVQDNDDDSLTVIARAMQELLGTSIENATSIEYATAFADLVAAACDRDEGDIDNDGILCDAEASDLWGNLRNRLHEEYGRQEGGYARLMFGKTKPATRRFLQLAFNRRHGHPKVLVAQSVVGREGLNLHKACRTVVLLHPEWNPGVVEQQIGRVDRLGSLWERTLDDAITRGIPGNELPRIEIRPVIFQGTYDEKNWQVLRDRWDDLRAQLHGIVISPRIAAKYSGDESIVKEINESAPNFSPVA